MISIINEENKFIIYMCILNINVILYQLMIPDVSMLIGLIKAIYHFCISLFFVFGVVWLLHYIRYSFFKNIIKQILLIISMIISAMDCFLLYQYHDVLDQAKIEIIMGTDPPTVYEFFLMYVVKPKVVIFCLLAIFVILSIKRLVDSNIFTKKSCMDGIGIILLLSIVAFMNCFIKAVKADIITQKMNWYYDVFYYNQPLARVAMDSYAAYESLGSDEDIYKTMDASLERIEGIHDNSTPYVIFILGESTDRNHMSLYGYNLETTPLLDARKKQKELAVFDDTISCANSTAAAMSMLFNFAEKGHENKWYTYPNIFDILKRTDYWTVWLSNQEPVGRWGNLDRIYANRADENYFAEITGGISGKNSTKLDDVLLPALDKSLIQNKGKKQFYTMHLMGAHEVYKKRYPEDFSKFTLQQEPSSKIEWKQIQAEYDNAILYDDYIVNEVIKRFEDKNAIIIFTSDHGMDVYNNDENFVGHSAENKGSKHMIEVPLVIWSSELYRQNNPDQWDQILRAVHRPFRTDNMIYMMLDIMGIESTSYRPHKDVINDAYTPMVRIYNSEEYNLNR